MGYKRSREYNDSHSMHGWELEITARKSKYALFQPGKFDLCIISLDTSFALRNPLLLDELLVPAILDGDTIWIRGIPSWA